MATGGAISGTSSGTTATLTSASAHGLATGDLVTIAGMTPSGYNGTYIATVTGSTTFTVTTSGSNLGASTVSGTASVPAQASFTARSAGTVPLVARAWQSGSQIQFLQTWVDSSNAVQWGVTSSGGLGGSDAITGLRFGIDRNVQLCGNTLSVGSGKGVIGLTNANTVPTSTASAGVILYANNGALGFTGTSLPNGGASGTNVAIVNSDGTFGNIPLAINTVSTSYTTVLSDAGKNIEMNLSVTGTASIPLNSSVAYPIGTQITFIQTGTAAVKITTASTGTTINHYSPTLGSTTAVATLKGQWAAATAVKRGTDNWVLIGNLT